MLKKVFRKIIAVTIITSLVLATVLSYPPILLKAEAATIHNNSNILSFIKDVRQYTVQVQKEQQAQNAANSSNAVQDADLQPMNLKDNNNQTNLSQQEIDKIVNAHMLGKEKVDQAPNQVVNAVYDGENQENEKKDRFIIKYRNENLKEETVQKVKGNIKERIYTKNKKFDVVITTEKMKKEEFSVLLKQKQADANIEYIQPDYEVTTASAELPQAEENITPAPIPTPINSESPAAPLLSKITFDGLKIDLTYEKTLNSGSLPSDNDFAVKGKDGQAITIVGIEIKENNVIMTIAAPIASGESITMGYVPGTNPIKDQAGNTAEGFTDKQVEASVVPELKPTLPTVDIIVPILKKAEIIDNTIILTYDEALNGTSAPVPADFSLICKDDKGKIINNVIKNVTVKDTEVSLTLANILKPGQTMQISYLPGKNPIEDLAGNQSEGFSNQEVINQSEILDTISPVLKEATINLSTLELNFDEQLNVSSIPTEKDFRLSLNDKTVTKTVYSISVIGKQVILNLKKPVAERDSVEISYISDVNTLVDLAGNKVKEIIDFPVKNITSAAINDPHFADQWALLPNQSNQTTYQAVYVGIDALNAWKASEGDGVVVAVLDTGIDITHEDLKDNIWTNKAEIPNNGIDDDGDGYIDDVNGWNFADKTNTIHNPSNISDEWHGTHVAGIIAAAKGNQKGVVGVAPKAKIMPLQVFKNGTAYTSDIISAIQYAKQNGAQIVNCSWGTTNENSALKEAMAESGLLFVAAAGNSYNNIDVNPVYPAALTLDNIISVASINKTGNLSRFSNYGQTSVDVAAPGEEILSTTPGNAYGISGGTSQAAAFVTGEAALILSKYPNASLSDIKTRIVNSSDKLSSLTEKVYGSDKINCASALTEPVIINDNIIQVPAESGQVSGTSTPDNGGINLYSVDEWNARGSMLTARDYFGAVTYNDKIYSVGGYNGSYLKSVEIYDPASGTSALSGSLNTARYGLGVGATAGKIYAIGGYNGSYLNTTEEYNPVTNIWSIKAVMPTARRFLGTAVVNDKIYAIGGYNGTYLNTVQVYDPATNTWSALASMPTARYGLGVTAVNGKIYAIGGYSAAGYLNIVEEYNPVTNIWTTKASMPITRRDFGTTAINGEIYTSGGYNGTYLSDVYEYNPVANVWGKRTNLAVARYGMGDASANGNIYAIGGYNGSYLNTVDMYGLPTNKWKSLNNMPTSRSEFGAAAVNGKIYAIGGYNGSTYLSTVEEYDKTTNIWTTKASMPTARYGLKVAAVNGKIYAVGGYGAAGYLNIVEEYNPITNTWAVKAGMSTARYGCGVTVVNGKIYAVGGLNANSSVLSTQEVYDPITNTWNAMASMPTARGYLGVTAANAKVYAIGGSDSSGYLNKVEEYDPVANTWTTKTSMPTARRGLGTESLSGKIYAIGGSNSSGYLNTVEEFDPLANTWITLNKENMFVRREFPGITSLDGKIYVIGGYNGSNLNTVEEYTPTKNPWTIKANMLTARSRLGSATVNGKIYTIGGYDGGYKSTVEQYDPLTNTWSTRASMPTPRANLGVTALDGKIYAIGGSDGNNLKNTVEVYDPATDTWSTKANMPTPRTALGVIALNGKIYAIGGYDHFYYYDAYNYIYYNTVGIVEVYDPATNIWSTKQTMPTGYERSDFGIAAYNNSIYVIGGYDENISGGIADTVEVYNPLTDTWSSKLNMPTARYDLSAKEINGKIYAGGGYDDRIQETQTVEEYDPAKNTWNSINNMPTAKVHLTLAEAYGKLYAIGGLVNPSYDNTLDLYLNTVEEYDPGTTTWNTKASMPTARSYLGTTTLNGKIYAVGGSYSGTYSNAFEQYDPATNTWSTKTNTNFTARDELGVVSLNGDIYTIGGYNVSAKNTVQMYDPDTDTWTAKGSLYYARKQLGVVSCGGKIYAIGGLNGSSVYKYVEAYDPATNAWSTKAAMTTARYGLGLAVVDGKIYAIGGYNVYNGTQPLGTVEVYDPVANTWSTKSAMPTSRSGFGIEVVNDKIYVLGGIKGSNQYLDTNEEYDPLTDTWSQKSAMMTARAGLGVTEVDGKIYAIGGIRYNSAASDLQTVEAYDPAIDSYTVMQNNGITRSSLGVTVVSGKIYAVGGFNNNYLNNVQSYTENVWKTWDNETSMLTARKDLGVTTINDKIYAIGGINQNGYLDTVEEYNLTAGVWTTKAHLKTPRAGLSVIAVNGRVYALGGYNGNYLNTVEEYDPYTDTWNDKANLLNARSDFSTVAIDGLIYVFGGKNSTGLINTVDIFDPIRNSWKTVTYLPTPRSNLGTAIVKGEIYVLGGYDGNNYLSVVEEYDPVNNVWTPKPTMLNPRAYYGTVSMGNKIYLIGGCNANGYLSTIEVYDPGTITWTPKATMPSKRETFGIAVENNKIYAVGGINSLAVNTVEEFDPATNTWTTKASMPTARDVLAAAEVNGKIYAIGGQYDSTISDKVEEFDPVTNTWSTNALNPMPTARWGLGAVQVNGIIYAIGGYDGSKYLNTVEAYDPAHNTWTILNSMPTNRSQLGVVAVNGKIYAVGGQDDSNALNNFEEYDPVTDIWTTKAAMPTARSALGVASANGKIYAIGGIDSGFISIVEEYDPVTDSWTRKPNMLKARDSLGAASVDGKIYAIGGYPLNGETEEGSLEDESTDSTTAELIHLGEENVNSSGNFSRTYTDMTEKTPGFDLNITRTYNSRDYKTDGFLGRGWSFGLQGSIKDYLTNQKIVRLPNGSAMTFTLNGSTYTANDSRATLVKQADNSFILTTKDQYTYGFTVNGWLNWMKDRNGNTITLTVNATNGQVTRITDQVGRQINIAYNTQGYISTVTDPASRIVQYQYNATNQLVKVIDPAGKSTNYTYNSDGYLATIKDNDNNLIESVVYDYSAGVANIRVARLTDANGNTSTYMYDTDTRKVTVKDINNREKTTWFDNSLYPIQTQDPDGRRSTTIYSLDANNGNKFGEALSSTDRNGNKTEFERDSVGNITRTYNPDSSTKAFGYDSKNNKIWEKDEGNELNTNGNYIYYIYDSNNINPIKKAQRLLNSSTPEQYVPGTNDSDFAVTNYTYYTNAQAQQQFGCNVTGLLMSVTDPNGHVTTNTYDTYGNIKTVTDAENKITTYNYNTIGWQTSVVSSQGYTTSYVYDQNGNQEKTTLNGLEVTRTTHDNMGRQNKVISANLYNSSLDNLTTDTYSGDQGTRYTYYPSGKVQTLTDAVGNTTTYTYDLYGNLLTETKPNGSIIQYYYDNLNRLTAVKFKDNSSANPVLLESLTYLILANGNTKKMDTKYLNDTDTALTTYTYDYKGQLIEQDNPDGTVKTTNYNANGTVNYTTDERGYTTYLRYDGLNRNNEQWIPTATDAGNNPMYTYINTVYDNAGNVLNVKTGKTTVSLYQVPTTFITQTKVYYNNNKLKSETDSAGRRIDYFYDDDWYLSEKDVYTSANSKNVTEYVNNYFGKPVTVKLHVRAGDIFGNSFTSNTDTVLTTTNTFDKNGNILTTTRPDSVVITNTYDNLDRPISTSMPGKDENNNAVTITTSTTYDWAGKVLTQTDANNHTTTNTYDQRERLTKITDAKNNSAASYYDLAGRLIAEVAPNNYDSNKTLTQMSRTVYTYDLMDRVKTKGYTYLDPVTSQWVTITAKAYKYDAKGNKIKELDVLGYEAGTGSTVDDMINTGYGTVYTYDPANPVLTVLDPVSNDRSLPHTTQYGYDSIGRKISETNANGIVTAYTYDDAGNLLTMTVNNQTIKTNTYDTAGNPLTQTDGNSNTITYSYNAWYKLMQAVYPGDATIPASTITYQYDINGNLKQKTDSAGPVDLFTYDNQGRELSHTQKKPDGTQSITTSIRFDKAGNKRFVVDGNNVTTENIYNEVNKLTSSKITVTNVNSVPTLQTTSYGYDADGNQTTKTDWLGNISTNVYDPLNRLIQKIDPLTKNIEKLGYNHNSAQITSTDALNKVTQFTYDKNNRRLSTIDPLNHTKSQTYDNVGNIQTTTDGNGKVTTNNYDAFNRLLSVVNAKNETTSYIYDLNNNKLSQTDGANHVTAFEYNAANKLSKKIDHGGRTGTYPSYTYNPAKTESYSYDADGNLLSKLDRNGNTTNYTYDVHGRMLSQTVGTLTISYSYDGNGNQLTLIDSVGTTTRTFDELNRTKSKTVPGIGTLTFLYDVTTGLPTGQVAETDTDSKNNVTTQVFDKAGRMISVTAGGNTTAYTYYDNGSKNTVLYPDGSSEVYTYYDDGPLQSLINKKADQTIINSYSYTYDAAHNQATKVDAKGTTAYTYDDLNRLLTVTEPSIPVQVTTYAYDAAGNRSTQTVTLGITSTVTTYTCNEQNRLTSTLTQQNGVTAQTVSYTYDNNGNQLTVTTVPYVNGVPQTAQVTVNTYDKFNQLSTTTMPDSTAITNTYNGEGLRVAKQVNSQATKYVYVGNKVILELDGSNNQTARNVQGTSLIARTVGGTTLYYMYNGHADVTALLDATGTIQGTYYYDAFGNITEQTGSVNNNITYAGYQYDKETGLYYLNARYYDPIIARFLSEDTFAGNQNDPLSLNLYTYCHNEPLMYTDPTGHWEQGELISKGSSGNDVVKIQQLLISQNYNLGIWGADGDFGNYTYNAVKAYQSANGLAVDGIVGDNTWAKMFPTSTSSGSGASSPPPSAPTNNKPSQVVNPPAAPPSGSSSGNSSPQGTVTPESIISNLGLGVKDTGVNIWEGLKSLTTLEGWNNLAITLTPMSWSNDEMLKKKLQMYDAIGYSIKTGLNEFVKGDWNVKAYYLSRVGSEVVLTLVGTKGAQYATKVINLGKASEVGEIGNIGAILEEGGSETGYATPTGGGGVTSQIKVGETNVTFGHGGRHLEGTGLTVDEVNHAIAEEITNIHPGTGEFYKGHIEINGQNIEYTSYGTKNGEINIGTYYPVK